MFTREHHDDLIVRLEVTVIECLQIRHGGIAALIQDGCPASNTAVTAVDYWQILLCLLLIQIIRDLIGDYLRIHLGHKPTQLPHPELYLHKQERTKFPWFTGPCMRYKGKQGIDQGNRIGTFF